jgi:hypothetical protein
VTRPDITYPTRTSTDLVTAFLDAMGRLDAEEALGPLAGSAAGAGRAAVDLVRSLRRR